ncbi:selenocysteine-specific elongation factor [Crossiella equi]|uniref:Selenocysteine-specific elongation factor n=1 Tax=Crossiella equi TaxID=130796 RepID=A0ABS5ALP7_9PSEU|nr:selenocysteine-specific elongation factor [Crossiella equi]
MIATAGHVDHGKSTLVRLLTGMEPDRWAEERRRGLTIDLGFAWTALGGTRIAFVDVPGHHRFVPNMLAGIGPVPAVMFVVAADEGWKPQSSEHLAALDALRVRHGVLVVTRTDLADPAPAVAEATERLSRTSLGTLPHVAVSARTGQGLDDLRAALVTLAARMPVPEREADVRLWLDRSFTVAGAGTVVTGTLAAGTISRGDELELASTGQQLTVRGLHTLGNKADVVTGVARVAVNLRGADRTELVRGDALLSPGRFLASTVLDVRCPVELPGQLVLHVGSAAVGARVRPLGTETARLTLARALPVRVGDRVLLRDPGGKAVLGGADVLALDPPRLRRGGASARSSELRTEDPLRIFLRDRVFARFRQLRAAGLVPPDAAEWHADPARWRTLALALPAEHESWQGAHPLEPGVPADVLRQRLGLPDPALLPPLVAAAGLELTDGRVRRPGAAALPARVETALAALAADLSESPFAAPDSERLHRLGLGGKEIAAAVRAGRLVRIADGVVLLPDAPGRAATLLSALPAPFTLSQARQALGTSRRVAVPLLELLDRRGVTERLPDATRRLR